ncbi:MAG: hypothetical protein KAT15_24580 [Bacteroidales bacterium]|nr:hypothetical protein [Bacteroidales bacterium]
MGHDSDKNRKLADYIYDDLNLEEVTEIEREILDDAELSESYRLNMMVKEYLKAKVQLEDMRTDPRLEDAELLADMAFGIESGNQQKPEAKRDGISVNRRRFLWYTSAMAASIAILITVGLFVTNPGPDRLFERYYKTYSASDFGQRGGVNDLYSDIAEGINSYKTGNFMQSIRHFNELSSDPGIQAEVDFFTGLSYMGLENYQDAQISLEKLVDSNVRYQPEAMWYLSLSYMKTGEIEKARALLSRLESFSGLYQPGAQALGKKLRRIRK